MSIQLFPEWKSLVVKQSCSNDYLVSSFQDVDTLKESLLNNCSGSVDVEDLVIALDQLLQDPTAKKEQKAAIFLELGQYTKGTSESILKRLGGAQKQNLSLSSEYFLNAVKLGSSKAANYLSQNCREIRSGDDNLAQFNVEEICRGVD